MKRKVIYGACAALFFVGLYGVCKPLPQGISVSGTEYKVPNESIHFFSDITYQNGDQRTSEQEIMDEILRMIHGADRYILVDMFLFNDFLGTATSSYRMLSSELSDALIRKKQEKPDITIQVITDPINTLYGEYVPEHLEKLKESGIPVTLTHLPALRDSNPAYSAFWRIFFRWIPENPNTGSLPNLLDVRKDDVGIQAYLNSFNFKANHRKVVIADHVKNGKRGFSVLTTSFNPHDGSSSHSNIALRVDDWLWRDALTSEKAVIDFSNGSFVPPPDEIGAADMSGEVTVQLLTEKAIKTTILEKIRSLTAGDALDMAMFYISDRDIVRSLKEADTRGVRLRLLFDPNKDAFGREKNGIPNRQVAYELMKHSKGNTEVRWCNTHGEQCHSKLLLITKGDSRILIQGSANLTHRNIGNFNLETNVLVEGDDEVTAIKEAYAFFNAQWDGGERMYSVGYDMFEDTGKIRTVWYRFGEFTGMSRY